MIIDSHAHYTYPSFASSFRYLTCTPDGYHLLEGNRTQLLAELFLNSISCSIEPGISLSSCEDVLQLSRSYPMRIFPAMGVHPTRCIHEKWRNRRQLAAFALDNSVVAIGETGLDYHYPRKEQHRLRQYLWFLYQLDLAWRLKKPLILHIRDAHKAALRILQFHPARKLGGVVHCFYGSRETARQYLALGFHIGIGGAILQQTDRSAPLWDAMSHIPLDRILLETDAPFVLPYCKDQIPAKALRKTRNSSLILPAVIEKIAQLKGVSPAEVEKITTQNTIALFHLPIAAEDAAK